MQSRRQALREKSCLGKKTFRSFSEAAAVIKEHRARYVLAETGELNIYRCPFGKHLHIGHNWPLKHLEELVQDFPMEVIEQAGGRE